MNHLNYKAGQKFEGFKFKSYTNNVYYSYFMDNFVGKVGRIVQVHRDKVEVFFQDGDRGFDTWTYPIGDNVTKIRELDYEQQKW